MEERLYKSTDLAEVMGVYTSSIRSVATPYYTPEQIAAWAPIPPDAARWRERLSCLTTVVAVSDHMLAGFASYTLEGYLDFLFTHPSFIRRGVATSLYKRVESALHTLDVSKVTTHASLAAQSFFVHHGFHVDAEECVECRGVYLRRFAMHKPIERAFSE